MTPTSSSSNIYEYQESRFKRGKKITRTWRRRWEGTKCNEMKKKQVQMMTSHKSMQSLLRMLKNRFMDVLRALANKNKLHSWPQKKKRAEIL